jgi:MYXO-CTERM domain-containing protein
VPAKLALSVGGYSGDYWILEVGPTYEYAVIGHPSRSYFWILSRSPTLDPATMQGVLGRAESNHFDTSQLEFTPQPPAGERVSSDAPVGPIPPAMTTGCETSPANGGGAGVWWLGLVIVAGVRRGRRRTS